MRTVFVVFGLGFLYLTGMTSTVRAQKNEAGLLAAWEQEQKADPSTTKFEKVGERRYHFVTKRFPFDGDLLVRNVSIQNLGSYGDPAFITGTVELELQGVSEDFHRTFAMSYGQWTIGNTLYWDAKGQSWVTADGRMKQAREALPRSRSSWTMLFAEGWSFAPMAVLFFLVFFLMYSLSRYNRRMREITARSDRSLALTERAIQLSERNVQLQEEHAKLLQEIRDLLKK
jgi:hypothetical protein